MNPQSETKSAAQLQELALDTIKPSATNPRKHFDQAALDELTTNVRLYGVLQPVLVRPAAPGKFELVAGERRWRAATAAQLGRIPAIVRDLTDLEVLEIQYIENLQRQDLTPWEEAEGFRKLIDSGSYTADTLAEKLGRSRSHIFARLKLLNLSKAAVKLVNAGEMPFSIAELIARIPDAKAQIDAIEEIVGRWDGCVSFRRAKEIIQDRFMKSLKGAPFDLADSALHPKAGACDACIHRTGARPELYPDSSPDVCTHPSCFREKVEAAGRIKADAARAAGQKVISQDEWSKVRYRDLYVKTDENCYLAGVGPKVKSWRALVKGFLKPVLVQTEEGTFEVYPKKEAIEAAKANGVKLQESRPFAGPSPAEREKARIKHEVGDAIAAAVVKSLEQEPKPEHCIFAARAAVDTAWHDSVQAIAKRRGFKNREELSSAVRLMGVNQAFALIIEILVLKGLRGEWGVEKHAKELVGLTGIDEKKIEKEVRAAQKQKPAKSAKPAAKKGGRR